jgi:hypothetical protein
MPPKRIKPEHRLDFGLTPRERDLIQDAAHARIHRRGTLGRRVRSGFGSRERNCPDLVGEKLLNYIRASDLDPSWAAKLPLFAAET